ncbi:PadR family transcriptional regulator [Pseudomonas sp. N040]|uniref:PadR family transcriptional regulator n=1 Tax=Pseudomonas sp. N040 TaxID=2785325 RepID=UPI0018A2CA71|nr:PadR family transcriptional regulator [Pseudomonas sp. N040]MBF7728932.1 PadR family transcriptional regulator [Pseudomonas sp. N040]MBW7012572.1 PadR family transcriptional regulator [Pseudomonas sp. N040]
MSLKHAILILLESQPGSGYDLAKRFKEGLGYFWNAKHQQIYQELKKLSAAGWLDCEAQAQDSRPDKKVYRLTAAGHAELLRWLDAPVQPNRINDALLVKLFGGAHTSTANLRAEMDRHLAVHRKTLDSLLAIEQAYLALPDAQRAAWRLPYLTLRRGILGEQAWLAWAAEAQQVLAE